MDKQALVIGLGQFGTAIAEAFAARGVEVLAIDENPDRIRSAPGTVEGVCLDATEEESLASVSPAKRDICVCAIGEQNRDASIICTALLRQLGAPMIVARANSLLHARVLKLVGAHRVVNPEKEYGLRIASQLLFLNIKGQLPLAPGILITESVAPAKLQGKTLGELQLPTSYSVTVVAVRRAETGAVEVPGPTTKVIAGDVLVLVGADGAVEKMLEALE